MVAVMPECEMIKPHPVLRVVSLGGFFSEYNLHSRLVVGGSRGKCLVFSKFCEGLRGTESARHGKS